MIDKKQGTENTALVKDDESEKEGYVFQKNTKTKLGATFIMGILVLIVAAIVVSLYFFMSPVD